MIDAGFAVCMTAYLVGLVAVFATVGHFGLVALVVAPAVFVIATLEFVYLTLGFVEKADPVITRLRGGARA